MKLLISYAIGEIETWSCAQRVDHFLQHVDNLVQSFKGLPTPVQQNWCQSVCTRYNVQCEVGDYQILAEVLKKHPVVLFTVGVSLSAQEILYVGSLRNIDQLLDYLLSGFSYYPMSKVLETQSIAQGKVEQSAVLLLQVQRIERFLKVYEVQEQRFCRLTQSPALAPYSSAKESKGIAKSVDFLHIRERFFDHKKTFYHMMWGIGFLQIALFMLLHYIKIPPVFQWALFGGCVLLFGWIFFNGVVEQKSVWHKALLRRLKWLYPDLLQSFAAAHKTLMLQEPERRVWLYYKQIESPNRLAPSISSTQSNLFVNLAQVIRQTPEGGSRASSYSASWSSAKWCSVSAFLEKEKFGSVEERLASLSSECAWYPEFLMLWEQHLLEQRVPVVQSAKSVKRL